MSNENQTEDSQIKVSTELLQKLYTFAASTNNYLMTIPVDGDNILRSAGLMKESNELFKTLKDLEKEGDKK